MRVYVPISQEIQEIYNHPLCKIHCASDNVDICDVRSLPPPLDILRTKHITGMVWRFIPLLDPLVDTFLSRDADSYILDREVAAVEEWLNSKYMFHSMRDHPYHGGCILGGE